MIIQVKTSARTQMIDITQDVQKAVSLGTVENGLCFVYVPHTTAAVTINESADPSVKKDVLMVLNSIVPWEADYRHMEGNSPVHVKSSLIGASELIAVENGNFAPRDGAPGNHGLPIR